MIAQSATWLVNTLCASAGLLFVLWLISVRRRDAGLVDLGWASGVGLAAVYIAVAAPGWPVRRMIVAGMAAFWAFRLAFYILTDRVLTPGEDGRYSYLRQYWGRRANLYFLPFFVLQSLLVLLFALPFLPLVWNPRAYLSAWELAGIALWLGAIVGESLADQQLAAFRADPANRGRVCRAGLWAYSRHPNYFFEWLHWWAYVLMAVGTSGWWLSLIGPAAMLLFLLRLTGIPYTEKRALASRGAAYRDYQRTTSMFVPLPRRSRT